MGTPPNEANYLQSLFQKIKVEDIMEKRVIKIYEDDDFSEAFIKFKENNITHLCVTNHANQLVGLLSQKYLYRTQSPRKVIGDDMEYSPEILRDGDIFYNKDTLDSYILRKVMHKNPFTMLSQDTLAEAIFQMGKKNLGCIPIINEERKIKGLLTDHAIVKFIGSVLSS